MSVNQEPKRAIPESDKFIENVLADSYAKLHEGLNREDVATFMAQATDSASDASTKVISLIGGAASGKGTLAKATVEAFARAGETADTISTDDYVVGDRTYRRERFEGREPLAKYDFGLMNEKIAAIKANDGDGEVAVPTYDPNSGVAIAAGEENYQHRIGRVDALIIEGDFEQVDQPDVQFYLHTEADARLQNRLGRDSVERAEADLDKIRANFEQRQASQHEPYTVPAVERADYVIEAIPDDEGWLYDVYAPIEPDTH